MADLGELRERYARRSQGLDRADAAPAATLGVVASSIPDHVDAEIPTGALNMPDVYGSVGAKPELHIELSVLSMIKEILTRVLRNGPQN